MKNWRSTAVPPVPEISARDINDYWVGDSASSPAAFSKQTRLWYRANPGIDAHIRQTFGHALADAECGRLASWQANPHGSLALVILLDQFTRNLNRGTSQAWRNDPAALEVAMHAVAHHQAPALSIPGRIMLYHPLRHAESPDAQQQAIELFQQLHDDAEALWKETLLRMVHAAENHARIIHSFGRFPHRNALLGRTSTPAEIDFLQRDSRSYGQLNNSNEAP